MTHQRLRKKAEAALARHGKTWTTPKSEILSRVSDEAKEFIAECSPAAILSVLAELDAARKDAGRWKVVRDGRGPGLRLITWDPKAHEELQVMFPSQKLCDEYADDAIDAALNADREK